MYVLNIPPLAGVAFLDFGGDTAAAPATAKRGGNILYQDVHTEWRQFRNMNRVTYDVNNRYAWF
jgi:hypothetical protein